MIEKKDLALFPLSENHTFLQSTVNSQFKKVYFPFLNRELFDLRNIYVVNLKTGGPKKMPYVGEFAT